MFKGIVRKLTQALLAGGVLVATAAVQAAEFDARLDWGQRVVLSTPVSGPVAEVNAQPGDRVEAGQVVLDLDPRPFRQKVKQAKARVDAIQPDRAEARRDVERAEELYDRTVLSDVELQQAKITFSRLDGQYRQAVTAHELAKLDLEYSRVEAPFDGMVLDVHTAPGATVVSRDRAPALVEIGSVASMTAVAALAPAEAAGVSRGQEATVIVDGREIAGEIAFLRQVDTGYEVGVRFTPETVRMAGAAAKVRLP